MRLEESDWSGTVREGKVSIPVWCDWKLDMLKCIRSRITFQFQCGAIGSRGSKSVYVNVSRFQFQCGAIGRITLVLKAIITFSVSIPVWCDWKSAMNA